MYESKLISENGSYVLSDESNSEEFFDALSVANESTSDAEVTFFHK